MPHFWQYCNVQLLLTLLLGSVLTASFYTFTCWYAIAFLFISGSVSYSVIVYHCCCTDNGATGVRSALRQRPNSYSPSIHIEFQKIVKLIVRDFIHVWYHTISQDKEVLSESVKILEHLSNDLQLRLQNIDIDKLLVSVLPLLEQYLKVLNDIGYVKENDKTYFDVSHHMCSLTFSQKVHLIHPALSSASTEKMYVLNMLDGYLNNSLPSCYSNCDVAVQFVRDSIATKVLLPLIDLVCNADILLEFVPLLLVKPSKERLENIMFAIKQENENFSYAYDSAVATHSVKPTPLVVDPPDEHWSLYGCNDDVVVVDIPSIYVHKYVCVDTRDGEHIGYIVKFPQSLVSSSLQFGVVTRELEALKRFSEFVKLHKDLSQSELGLYMTGSSLPDRRVFANIINKISLSNEPDPALLLERKEGLEHYLQSISSIKQIKESEILKDFLLSGVKSLHEADIKTSIIHTRKWDITESIDDKKPNIKILMPNVLSCYLEFHFPLPYDEMQSTTEDASHGKHSEFSATSKSPTNFMSYFTYAWQLLNTLFAAVKFCISHLISGSPFVLKQQTAPTMINTLLSLVNEATRTTTRELWITSENTQLAFLKIFGHWIDKNLLKELHDLVHDESLWVRILYTIRHTVWPGGNLIVALNRKQNSYSQRKLLQEEATFHIRQFLPFYLKYFIGKRDYNRTIQHCTDCILNEKINRHFLFKALDIAYLNLVPDYKNADAMQENLLKLRAHSILLGN